jgi:diguanylate cyclase (GGDEF)-like protein|tara:strand:- start:1295 stop:1525 length:231 start_codon:yes stop_codon:yes gene_type:complete
LPESDISSARRIAQRIHTNIAENSFASPGGGEFRVTCSIGVAEYIRKSEDAQALLERADRALYQAKEDGRNRISFS